MSTVYRPAPGRIMPARFLSKSKYMLGRQCLKLLWLTIHEPARVPETDKATQRIFDQGHMVGELAKRLFPDGIDISKFDFRDNLKRSKEMLDLRKPLFEAGFMADGLFSRVDILKPAGEDSWDIIEVKSSTSVKEENLEDVAFQKLSCEKAGLRINRCYLAHLNNQYVRQGEIDSRGLFRIEDISDEASEAGRDIDQRIASMFVVIRSKTCPEVGVGRYCSSPYNCAVTLCWEELPEHNIFSLYRGGKKCFELFEAGILNIKEIPSDYKLTMSQQIQKSCDISGEPYIDRESINNFLSRLQYPLHYLDFETFSPAVPYFDGTRPFQRIPFQFSLHRVGNDGAAEHISFLSEGQDDPRPIFLSQLIKSISPAGSIITYNQAFEESVLDELAISFPEYAVWIEDLKPRLIDLLEPFRDFYYYHPAQSGSASIKSVLPALTGQGYEGLEITGGEDASAAYLEMNYGDISSKERNQIKANLEKYCGLDTEAMIRIVAKLGS
jgi:hypothetical protein